MHTRLMQAFRALVGISSIVVLIPASVALAQWGGGRSSQYSSQIAALGDTVVTNISIPILLGVEVSDLSENFGDPRSGERTHQGLDIVAPSGTPIASPTDAVVTGIGNGTNSGLYVRTANPGGESFTYMHLSEVAKNIERGDVLKRGDILGFVGNTGNASGGAAHLHLEIRKSGSATNPFPRLQSVFSLTEQIAGVTQALERSANANLASALVKNFKSIFVGAKTQGMTLPTAIDTLLVSGVSSTNGTEVVSDGLITMGDENAEVTKLQTFLIARRTGPAAVRLASAGATGYFGTITKAALIEYQNAVSLPATGYVDQVTYQYMFEFTDVVPEEDSSESEGGTVSAPAAFIRNLEVGDEGADVKMLQQYLNSKGFIVATSGAGSPGNESTYFGTRTESALATFQKANGISPAAGYFGPITRLYITKL